MGYNQHSFGIRTTEWLDKGWLPAGGRLLEFGSQEFYREPEATRAALADFLRRHEKSEKEIDAILPNGGPARVSAIYRAIGIDYTSIDVDGMHGSEYLDLNTFVLPDKWRGHFDFINTGGTIEHLVNPINGFHIAHEAVKLYGVVHHSSPLTGMRDHGYLYGTPKFYAWLCGENRYEVLKAKVTVLNPSVPFDDPLFTIKPDGLALPDIMCELVYRKTRNDPFVFPADHLYHESAKTVAATIHRNMTAYAQARLTGDAP